MKKQEETKFFDHTKQWVDLQAESRVFIFQGLQLIAKQRETIHSHCTNSSKLLHRWISNEDEEEKCNCSWIILWHWSYAALKFNVGGIFPD